MKRTIETTRVDDWSASAARLWVRQDCLESSSLHRASIMVNNELLDGSVVNLTR